ncbi:MAG: asparaginase domain-containing protein [Chitinophagales bacterium]
MALRILITGGTFDKEYNMIDGSLHFTETHLPEILEMGRCTVDYSLRTLMMIDSLEMTEADREIIRINCQKCDEENILITHGTDTMTETAKFLAAANIKKTIVLTGAMMPYKFGASDALFNLGSAMAFAQALDDGVYIVMNGKFHAWDEVNKNKKTGIFEEID